jgi:polyisoprenoid-binding protein YceI
LPVKEEVMDKWVMDPDHSVAGFTVRHMMVTNVRGQFNRIAGAVYFDPSNIAASSVEATIDVGCMTTGVPQRDEHLLSDDFFDAARFPDMFFRSTKVEGSGSNSLKVSGSLTIRGITRQVTLDAEFSGPVRGTDGELSVGFSGTTRINREDFGVNWNVSLEDGGVVVGKEVRIYIDVEADLVK